MDVPGIKAPWWVVSRVLVGWLALTHIGNPSSDVEAETGGLQAQRQPGKRIETFLDVDTGGEEKACVSLSWETSLWGWSWVWAPVWIWVAVSPQE